MTTIATPRWDGATGSDSNLAAIYDRDGFVLPLDVLDGAEARALRDELEAAEAEVAGDGDKPALLNSYPDRLLPAFDAVVRHPVLLDAVSRILGPDLMVWSAGLFIKEPHTPHRVSWHQDLTYWALDDAEEVTAWLALSPATRESGCMQFVAGSHKRRQVAHVDTFAADNLLTRGQEIAVEVDPESAVYAELHPGQASLHHGHLFHASDPNGSNDRRIAAAIRYIRPSMRQTSGDKTLVRLVRGEDRFGHFTLAGAPEGRLSEADFARCRVDSGIKRRLLYAGAEDKAAGGKRYREG